MSEFTKELEHLINKNSLENESNTPDWILAEYLRNCMNAFTVAVNDREKYYDRYNDTFLTAISNL